MGTLAEDKRKALKQAQKESHKPIKTQKSEEIPIDTVIDVHVYDKITNTAIVRIIANHSCVLFYGIRPKTNVFGHEWGIRPTPLFLFENKAMR